jgi:membrane fusion protein, multidrug efflux system
MKKLTFKAFAAICMFASNGAVSHAEVTSARGVIRAVTEATVSADYSARIRAMPFLEGNAFKKGDILVAFECERFMAEISAAEANVRAKQLVYVMDRKLLAKGAVGANETQVAQAEYEQARSEMMAATVKIGSCQIRAAFDGRVEQRIAKVAESPAANQPIIRIVDTTAYEVEVIMPSKWLRQVKVGASFGFAVDDTGESVKVEVSRIAASVDPVSQSVKIYGVFHPEGSSVLPGMSGTATFAPVGS